MKKAIIYMLLLAIAPALALTQADKPQELAQAALTQPQAQTQELAQPALQEEPQQEAKPQEQEAAEPAGTCKHQWAEDWYTTDWGEYKGYICIKCGEGEYWLQEEPAEEPQQETVEQPQEVVEEPAEEPQEDLQEEQPQEYDWETYEKLNKDEYGFNKGECDTSYAYNEEYFYNEGYDHWNVDKVYDSNYANSKPPYNEHAKQFKEQQEKAQAEAPAEAEKEQE